MSESTVKKVDLHTKYRRIISSHLNYYSVIDTCENRTRLSPDAEMPCEARPCCCLHCHILLIPVFSSFDILPTVELSNQSIPLLFQFFLSDRYFKKSLVFMSVVVWMENSQNVFIYLETYFPVSDSAWHGNFGR